ncbi:hypothetical protein HPB49_014533 [Dermacentor silvarum]|uniref:Uncharacterized protein n=1 Tax=Dermacentor silvarum TaxID=543639 RepID=A0ACB8DPR7_DERSI|nr:hypothetical protein HPB49_014533 [Dermacentor silvarum]
MRDEIKSLKDAESQLNQVTSAPHASTKDPTEVPDSEMDEGDNPPPLKPKAQARNVVSTLEDARASGDLAMLLLIDVKGAFDGLPHAVVQQALDLLGIGGNLRRFLSSFLNDRTLRVRVGHARSTPRPVPVRTDILRQGCCVESRSSPCDCVG